MSCEILRSSLLSRILLCGRGSNALIFRRLLTSGEVSTALRPFYFSVHPDLFGKFPSERAINESSLQVLSSYIQTLQQNRPPRPTTVTFYLRPNSNGTAKALKPVKIKLVQRDLKNMVTSILSTCDLPTTYVDSLTPPKPPLVGRSDFQRHEFKRKAYRFENDPNMGFQMKQDINKVKGNEALLEWLCKNVSSARDKLKACEPTREEVKKLQLSLCESLGLNEVVWDCGWDITHFRGCLQAFNALALHHKEEMSTLKGRTLVFGNDTGVTMEGQILLNSGEVRNNWLDFIKKIPKDEAILRNVPAFEKAVSRVLREIQVVRRKFQPKTMAKQYENNLRRLTTSLSDYQGSKGYPKCWPDSLAAFELVVETEAGPLMLSPTGQFIVPCSCPSFLIVNFMTDNLNKATQLLNEYKSHKWVERELHRQCLKELNLQALTKDDCITPLLMITCLQNLLKHKSELILLDGVRLAVTNYYSVMSDGQMCIPWNWKL